MTSNTQFAFQALPVIYIEQLSSLCKHKTKLHLGLSVQESSDCVHVTFTWVSFTCDKVVNQFYVFYHKQCGTFMAMARNHMKAMGWIDSHGPKPYEIIRKEK